MKKMDFTIPFNQEWEEEKQTTITKLKNDPSIHALIQRGMIDESCIDQYPMKLNRWLQSYQPCIGCSGLINCKQKKKGYYSAVQYDGMLNYAEKACTYKRMQIVEEQHLDYFVINDMPKKMNTVAFKKIDGTNESGDYIDALRTAISCSQTKQSLYLYGTMGTGKTYLAACACNQHARMKERVAFVHYPTACSRLASMLKTGEYKKEFQLMVGCDFLVLDDIGAESVTEWNRDSILLPLLNARYESQKPTWFTSNCDLETLLIHFRFSSKGNDDELKASRILERIQAMSQTKALTGKDRRNL